MSDFELPQHLVILKTEHWTLNHRVDSALPGYLMLGARLFTNDLSAMPQQALAELEPLLARAQRALTAILEPEHFISDDTAMSPDTRCIFTSCRSAPGSSSASLAIPATACCGIFIIHRISRTPAKQPMGRN